MSKNVTFQVDEAMAEALKEAASREFCSVGAVIRRAIYNHLQESADSDSCQEAAKAML